MFLNSLSNWLQKQQKVLTVLSLVIYYKPVVKEHFTAPQLSVLNFFLNSTFMHFSSVFSVFLWTVLIQHFRT